MLPHDHGPAAPIIRSGVERSTLEIFQSVTAAANTKEEHKSIQVIFCWNHISLLFPIATADGQDGRSKICNAEIKSWELLDVVALFSRFHNLDFTGCVSKQSLRPKSLAIKVRKSVEKERQKEKKERKKCYMLKTLGAGSGQHPNVFLKDLSPL